MLYESMKDKRTVINPRRACAVRVMVLGLWSICLSLCVSMLISALRATASVLKALKKLNNKFPKTAAFSLEKLEVSLTNYLAHPIN